MHRSLHPNSAESQREQSPSPGNGGNGGRWPACERCCAPREARCCQPRTKPGIVGTKPEGQLPQEVVLRLKQATPPAAIWDEVIKSTTENSCFSGEAAPSAPGASKESLKLPFHLSGAGVDNEDAWLPVARGAKTQVLKALHVGKMEHKKTKISSQNLCSRWPPYNQTSEVQLWDYVI